MASFAWSTVYCFDYCWMFRGSFRVSDTFKFVPYSIFGWGIPLILLSIASTAQFQSPQVSGFSPSLNPNFGLIRCWFSDERVPLLVFFYGPVSFLIALNVIFFVRLLLNPNLMNCYKKKNSGPQLRTNRTKEKASSMQKHKNDFQMALKLFFITGIPWIFELSNWLLPTLIPDLLPHQMKYLFEISNLFNSLRGVIIFIVFILLQRNVRQHLQLSFSKHCSMTAKNATDSRSLSVTSRSQLNTESVRTTSTSTSNDFHSQFQSSNQAVSMDKSLDQTTNV